MCLGTPQSCPGLEPLGFGCAGCGVGRGGNFWGKADLVAVQDSPSEKAGLVSLQQQMRVGAPALLRFN